MINPLLDALLFLNSFHFSVFKMGVAGLKTD